MANADTSFLVDVLSNHPPAVAKLDELLAREQPLWIPAPALQELHLGAGLHSRPDREGRRIEELERAMPALPFDAPAARVAGAMEAEAKRRGRPVGRIDAQIAAIALLRGEAVVTADAGFPRPLGLAVESY